MVGKHFHRMDFENLDAVENDSSSPFKVRVHDLVYKDWGIFEPNRPLEGLNMGMYCSKNKFQASEKSTSSTTGKSYKRDQGKIAFEPISPGLRPVCLLKMVPAGP